MSGADSGAIFDLWLLVGAVGVVGLYLIVRVLAWWAFR